MDPAIDGLLGLGVDVSLPDKTAESGLDMSAGAAKAVVEIEMAKGGI